MEIKRRLEQRWEPDSNLLWDAPDRLAPLKSRHSSSARPPAAQRACQPRTVSIIEVEHLGHRLAAQPVIQQQNRIRPPRHTMRVAGPAHHLLQRYTLLGGQEARADLDHLPQVLAAWVVSRRRGLTPVGLRPP